MSPGSIAAVATCSSAISPVCPLSRATDSVASTTQRSQDLHGCVGLGMLVECDHSGMSVAGLDLDDLVGEGRTRASLAARCWDVRAKSSYSALLTLYFSATASAVTPMWVPPNGSVSIATVPSVSVRSPSRRPSRAEKS